MPLCARCLGAGVGHVAALGGIVCALVPPAWLCALLPCATFIDWALQEYLNIMSTNPRRLVTGIAGGIGIGFLWWQLLFWVLTRVIR